MEALARAHEHGDTVLVTGSLYLLGDIAQRGGARHGEGDGAAVRAAFAALLVGAIIAIAFGLGYGIGKLLL